MDPEQKKETLAERQERELREKVERISQMRNIDGGIFGYVYRLAADRSQVALPPIYSVMDDDEIGVNFGPGKYRIIYFQDLDDGTRKAITTMTYNIGREYLEPHRDFCKENGKKCLHDGNVDAMGYAQNPGGNGLGDLLEPKKMQAAAGFLAALKMILNPDNGNDKHFKMLADQNAALIQAAFNRAGNGPSDAIVTKAMDVLAAPTKQQNDFEARLAEFTKIQNMVQRYNPTGTAPQEVEQEEPKGTMEKLIDKALDSLPAFLESFNGNVKQAATAAKAQNKITAAIIKASPALQEQFYQSMVQKFGKSMADQWAAAYGLTTMPNVIPFQAAPMVDPEPAQIKKVVF